MIINAGSSRQKVRGPNMSVFVNEGNTKTLPPLADNNDK